MTNGYQLPEENFWNNTHPLSSLAQHLNDNFIPAMGEVPEPRKNRALEKFRKAQNIYYDVYNNGLCNRGSELYKVFGFGHKQYAKFGNNYRYGWQPEFHEKLNERMAEIVQAAVNEQFMKGKQNNDAK